MRTKRARIRPAGTEKAHETRIEDRIMEDGGGDADRAGMRAYYRQLIAEGYDPVPPELRRATNRKIRAGVVSAVR